MAKADFKKKKSITLEPIREELERFAAIANQRVSQLAPNNKALQEAQRTLPKSRRGENQLFKGNIQTLKGMKREYSRIMQFLSDWRSTEEGDAYYASERDLSKYKGAFGGQWLKKYGETYDTSRISEDKATLAFGLYDRLIEEYQSEDRARMLWNKDSSLISYGSENMIAAIYDMVEQGYDAEDIMQMARTKMEINYLELQHQAEFSRNKYDYGSLNIDYLNSDMSRKEILNELAKRYK